MALASARSALNSPLQVSWRRLSPVWSSCRSLICSASLRGEQRIPEPLKVPSAAELDSFVGMKSEFPCLQKSTPGPEPSYHARAMGAEMFNSRKPFRLRWGGVLPEISIAYETWGTLNAEKSNAVLIHPGLSASCHAKSNDKDPSQGWWESFIGPGRPLDTDRFFFICSSNLGAFGSTGPYSWNPVTGDRYAMSFPLLTHQDMVRAQFMMLDHLGINKIYAAVGSSAGGMQSIATSVMYTERVERIISISACLQSAPVSIAFRFLQRQALMSDPLWNMGNYYGKTFPSRGMKGNRMLGMVTYRSGPEWMSRFGRKRIADEMPSMCPDFEIESYLDHQGHKLSQLVDPNSFLYLSKATDLFDIADGEVSYETALRKIMCPVLIVGVQSDILINVEQQKAMADELRRVGNRNVTYYEVDSDYGHDTFLLDLANIGTAIKGFLETGNRF